MGRELLSRSFENLGVDQKIWLNLEGGGYGVDATTGLLPDDSGSVDFITFDIKFNIPREDSASRSGRSVAARLSSKITVELSNESRIIPGTPDALGNPTLPPLHPLLLSAFGEVDLSNPAEIVYKLSRFNENSFRVLEEATHYSRLVTGCFMDSVTFSLPGDSAAQMNFQGFAQNAFIAGESKLAQAITGLEQIASAIVQDLTYTALVSSGSDGNLVNISYVGGGTQGAETVVVTGDAIEVTIEDGVSQATDIEAAINGEPLALALVTVAVTGTGTNPQNITPAPVFLTGGLNDDQIIVSLAEGLKYEIGAIIDIVDGTDGNTLVAQAKKIIAVGEGPNIDILTLEGGPLPAAALNDFVIGHAPENFVPITSEFALLGLNGSISINGQPLDCELISAEIGITNNFTKRDFLYGTDQLCGFPIPAARREVSVNLQLILNRDNFLLYSRNKRFISEDITITLEPQRIPGPAFSTSQGRTFEWRIPKAEFDLAPIENPSDSFVTLALEGKALAPSSNNLDEELTLTIR